LIQRNAYLLAELQNWAGKNRLVVLDTEDYLDPHFAREAFKKGIDMNFMVNYVGGDDWASSLNSSSD
jgi:hypothetical protein